MEQLRIFLIYLFMLLQLERWLYWFWNFNGAFLLFLEAGVVPSELQYFEFLILECELARDILKELDMLLRHVLFDL